jgi:uncharacterized protein DUF6356
MFEQFSEHPAAVGESYLQHFVKAAVFGGQMIAAGLACVVHAALPFLFQHTASDMIGKLNQAMEQRRLHNAESENSVPDKVLSARKSATS